MSPQFNETTLLCFSFFHIWEETATRTKARVMVGLTLLFFLSQGWLSYSTWVQFLKTVVLYIFSSFLLVYDGMASLIPVTITLLWLETYFLSAMFLYYIFFLFIFKWRELYHDYICHIVRYVDWSYIRINCNSFPNYKYLFSTFKDFDSADLTWVSGILFLKLDKWILIHKKS